MKKIDILPGGYIYTRAGAKKGTWQLYYYVDGQELKCSLKTADEHEAIVSAKRMILESAHKASKGQKIRPTTFADVAETYLKKVGDKGKKETEYKRITESYLIPYFGAMEIGRIAAEDVESYYEWRQEMRTTQIEEEKRKHAARVEIMRNSRYAARRAKAEAEFSTGFIRNEVSASTRNSENVVIRAIFKHAARAKYISASDIPLIENAGASDQEPREGFKQREVEALLREAERGYKEAYGAAVQRRLRLIFGKRETTNHEKYVAVRHVARHLCADKDAWGKWKLWHAVAILAGTGMRPQSLLWMQGHHIGRLDKLEAMPQAYPLAGVFDQPKYLLRATTRKGKGGRKLTRDIVPEGWLTPYLVRVQTQPKPTDALFDYSNSHSINKRFKLLLQKCGLTYGKDGKERSLYSLRHYYITKKLIEGVAVAIIAENTMTSMQMIEKYYAHIKNTENYTLLSGNGRQ